MKTERTEIEPPRAKACAACPWRISNLGKPNPPSANEDSLEYYSPKNLKRLWDGLRTGDAPGMTCHPTDPMNQPTNATTHECSGWWLIVMREIAAFEAAREALEAEHDAGGPSVTPTRVYRAYKNSRPKGTELTQDGLTEAVFALLPRPLGRGLARDTEPLVDDKDIAGPNDSRRW